MNTYQCIYVESREVFSYKDDFRDELLHLFISNEVQRLAGTSAAKFAWGLLPAGSPRIEDGLVDQLAVTVLQATASTLRQRLDVLGYGEKELRRQYAASRDLEVKRLEKVIADLQGLPALDHLLEYNHEKLEHLKDLPFDLWLEGASAHITFKRQASAPSHPTTGPLAIFKEADARWLLRILACIVEPDALVTLDVTEMDYDGLLDRGFLMDTDGSGYRAVFNPGPPIVITEGRYDSKVLRAAIEILMPHLSHYIRFFDFEFGNEGGASSTVKTLKSFAAAGVSNRIIALFDNDAAAYEAVLGLTGYSLPPHYKVVHYPPLESARSYPTIGPTGELEMDVNGLACSIELYLGDDILSDEGGNRTPIQWKGFMGKVKRYQGEVVGKKVIQDAFDRKAISALADRRLIGKQDWSGMRLILDRIFEALAVDE
ncbi:hypothetical protein [Paractinoplanes hotanensis]|uniref:HEPN/Toprim N-terminal domain-containing protein n=1 Tax=Paractinoplanes hotanensis TaxID=2906497 RepID=A0ABT0XWZ2_9ACTN|nr:hypothetical protein [Actinoplanes hotanensis]MCM4078307.1 hypothetical protein [Actinoplanes hotanensis]